MMDASNQGTSPEADASAQQMPAPSAQSAEHSFAQEAPPAPPTPLPPLPAEVYDKLAKLRFCVAVMYFLCILRLVVEPYYAFPGSVIELIVAAVATDVLRHDAVAAPLIEKAYSFLPDLRTVFPFDKLQGLRGVGALKVLVPLCMFGCYTEVRHSLYMNSADASSLWIAVPFTVYGNALLYFAVMLLALETLCAAGDASSGYYARTDVANSSLGHPDTFSDEEDMRRAVEASRRDAMAGLTPAQRMEAVGAAPAGQSEDDQIRQAQQASLSEMEQIRLMRQNQYRAAGN